MLKGFPNQVNRIAKLSRALTVIGQLETQGLNPRDDAVFGEALLRSHVISPRGRGQSLDDYLARYRAGPRQNRPYEFTARALREFFRFASCLEEDAENNEAWLTPIGRQLATHVSDPPTPGEKAAWRIAARNIRVGDADRGFSHPYQVLLRLIERRPNLASKLSPLALEANDDSAEELDRLCALADIDDEGRIRDAIGGETKANWDNGKKILPGIAEQVGDLSRDGDHLVLIAAPLAPVPDRAARAVEVEEPAAVPQGAPARIPRRAGTRRGGRAVTAGQIARAGIDAADPADDLPPVALDPLAAAEAIAARAIRLTRHNEIVRLVAKRLENAGATLREGDFDCLALIDATAFLFEVKTLDGTFPDEVARVRHALGQLLYYVAFSIPLDCPPPALVALFERPPGTEHIRWLQGLAVHVAWVDDDSFGIAPGDEEILAPLLIEGDRD